jgi:hypothetical protein
MKTRIVKIESEEAIAPETVFSGLRTAYAKSSLVRGMKVSSVTFPDKAKMLANHKIAYPCKKCDVFSVCSSDLEKECTSYQAWLENKKLIEQLPEEGK